MGRYEDYREQKRRGYDDDYTPRHRVAERLPSNPRQSAPRASEPVESMVKWFNPEKGFGFVTLSEGSDAFLHVRLLEAAGHRSVAEGVRVKVRIGPGQKGPQVSEVIEVDRSTAQTASTPERLFQQGRCSHQLPANGPVEESVGSVKWYNAEKGFGFIGLDDGRKDVFVHVKTLERGGLSGLTEGQRVWIKIRQGQKSSPAESAESWEPTGLIKI